MKNVPVIIWILLGIAFILAIYEFIQLKKIVAWQVKADETLNKFSAIEIVDGKVEVVETKINKKETNDKRQTTNEEEQKGTEKQANAEPTTEELAKQQQQELEQDAIDLIARPFEKLTTKTKLNNHIEKLEEILKGGQITDEKILGGAREKIKSCAEYLLTLEASKKGKKNTDKDDK